MKIEISTEGKPTLIKTKLELESIMRSGMDDTRVDLVLLVLEAKGFTSFTHKGVVINVKRID
jgi:hypothetical protein